MDEGGWFSTGDVATIDPDGFIELVDRSKDVIKSGGEWISSIAVENVAAAHEQVRQLKPCLVPCMRPEPEGCCSMTATCRVDLHPCNLAMHCMGCHQLTFSCSGLCHLAASM